MARQGVLSQGPWGGEQSKKCTRPLEDRGNLMRANKTVKGYSSSTRLLVSPEDPLHLVQGGFYPLKTLCIMHKGNHTPLRSCTP